MLRWISLFVFIIIQNAFEKWKKNTEKGFWWKKNENTFESRYSNRRYLQHFAISNKSHSPLRIIGLVP